MTTRTRSLMAASAAYFTIVFMAGFVLGTVRVLLLVPNLGETWATLAELPFMLGISWVVCGNVIAWFSVPRTTMHRLTMGGIAFALLMVAEVALSTMVFGRPIEELMAGMGTTAEMLGLAGQVVFGLMPLIHE